MMEQIHRAGAMVVQTRSCTSMWS